MARVKQRESGEEFKYKVLIEEAEKEYALAEELCYKQDFESAMEHVRNVEGLLTVVVGPMLEKATKHANRAEQ